MEPQKTPKLEYSEEAKLSRSELFTRLQTEKRKVAQLEHAYVDMGDEIAELRAENDIMRHKLLLIPECLTNAVDKALQDLESGVKGIKAMVYDIQRGTSQDNSRDDKDRAGNWNFSSLQDAKYNYPPRVPATPLNTPVLHWTLPPMRMPVHNSESIRRAQAQPIDPVAEKKSPIAEKKSPIVEKKSPIVEQVCQMTPPVTVAQHPDSPTEKTSTTDKNAAEITQKTTPPPPSHQVQRRQSSLLGHDNVRVAVSKASLLRKPSGSSPAVKRKVSVAAAANGSGLKQMRTEPAGVTTKPPAPVSKLVAGRVTIPKKPVVMVASTSARDKMDPALTKKADTVKRVKGAGAYKIPGQPRL